MNGQKIQVKQILELRDAGLSQNSIAKSFHMSKSSVGDVFQIAQEKSIFYEGEKLCIQMRCTDSFTRISTQLRHSLMIRNTSCAQRIIQGWCHAETTLEGIPGQMRDWQQCPGQVHKILHRIQQVHRVQKSYEPFDAQARL